MADNNINSINDDQQPQSKGEFLDAIRRHICQILGFDFGFIDVAAGHEIKNVASFCFDDEADVANEFVESLVDEHKQPVTTSNTLVAQKVKQTQRSWVGKAYALEDVEKGLEEENEGFPYLIVPVISNPSARAGEVTGLIRVISFDAAREINAQDLTTLKLMGEHLASRTGLFGELTSEQTVAKPTGDAGDLDHVLVVHSNRLVRRRFNRILGSGYHVVEAESSERALEALDAARVDVILLDSELQGASGFGFCKVLKESTKWKHIPVILVVTDNSTTARVEGLNVGADDCIPDSCFDAELLARVRSSLRHRKAERELSVQLQLLEDYAQRLEKAHEQLSIDRQDTIQRNSQLEQMKREGEVQRHQDNLLHRISNIIRKSFHIRENLEEMLEALSGWFSLDCTFIVMPNDEEPEDTIRVECVSDKAYKVVAYDRDLDIYEIFKKNFQADQSIIANDAASDRRLDPFHKILKSGFSVQSLFFIPITYEQKLQGLLVGYKCEARANWSRINETFMKAVVDQVAVGVVNARLYATVQRQATTDGLTGLFNHRTGQEKLADQLKQAERYQRRLSVIMLDVDHFKSINDTYGHPAGDSVLKAVARLIRNNCRDVDIPVRYGGEEFLLVLPEVTQDGATVVAERIRVALKAETIRHENVEINIAGSFGVACFPDDADNQQNLLDLADKSLYLSKRLGRDQVHTASDLMFEPEAEDEKRSEDVAKEVRDGVFTPPEISEAARQHEELVPEVVDMVKSLAASLYAKSEYNKQHHLEVARMSELLAKVMGLSAQQVEQIRVAGLLHDVGVLQLPQELLHKEGRLTKEERDVVNQHATLGAQMLRPVRALKDICEILENHHERWDGTGYPRGLRGEDIPLPARIVAIVDSYHAMISERPYRKAMTHDEAVKVLKDGAGKQWDPFLIEIFSAVMKSMRETTQEVQAKVALAATLARAGSDPEKNYDAADKISAARAGTAQPGELGHDHREPDHAHEHGREHPDNRHEHHEYATAEATPSAHPAETEHKETAGDEHLDDLEPRSERSKISEIIGPVIKPIGPRTDAPADDERSISQSMPKLEVEEDTAGSAAPQASPAPHSPASGEQDKPPADPLPEKHGFAVPAPAPGSQFAVPASPPPGGLAGLARPVYGPGPDTRAIPADGQLQQPGPIPNGHPAGQAPPAQPVLEGPQPGMQSLQSGMPPAQPGMPTSQQGAQPPHGSRPIPAQQAPQGGPPAPGQMPMPGHPGPMPVGGPGIPPQPGQPQMPKGAQPQGGPPGMLAQGPPGSSYNRLPVQGAPPPSGPGSSYNRLPAQSQPVAPPPGPDSSYNRLPAQGPPQGAPQQAPPVPGQMSPQPGAPASSYNRLPQQAPPGQVPQPGQMPQAGPPQQAGIMPPQGPPGYAPGQQPMPGMPGQMAPPAVPVPGQVAAQTVPGVQPGQTASQPIPGAQAGQIPPQGAQPLGYPRPYAAGQPVALPPQPGQLVQQAQQPGQPQPAPAHQSAGMPAANPQPAPVLHPPAQTPAPSPASSPAPTQQPPQATTDGAARPSSSLPPKGSIPTGTIVEFEPGATAATSAPAKQQPDTWDPYSDYDDEDEIEGGL